MDHRCDRFAVGRRTVVGFALLFAMMSVATPASAATMQMSQQTRALLESMLDDDQMAALEQTLSVEGAWNSLGPKPTGEPEPLPVDPPAQQIELTIPDDAEGAGTADDPYVNVLSTFLERFEYEPVSIRASRSYPDPNQIESHIETLAYEPTLVRVPAGHYRESVRPVDRSYGRQPELNIALDVPPAIWLEGEGDQDVVITAAIEPETNGTLAMLNIRAGLVNVTLDGSGAGEFEPNPETRLHGVMAAHEAVIADSHLHDLTGRGITAVGSRGREGSDVVVSNNIIENVGYSGVSSQSRWLVRDNQIRYAGVLRASAGDDGIIPRYGIEGRILNNLVILERRPHARHVISGQVSHEHLVAGNISIAKDSMRNNVGFSDGSHNNRFIGNVALGTGITGSRIQAGFSINGHGNVLEHNVSIGNPRGFRTSGTSDDPGRIRHNYSEHILTAMHRSGTEGEHYMLEDNTFKQSGQQHERRRMESPLPHPEPEAFGFFKGESR